MRDGDVAVLGDLRAIEHVVDDVVLLVLDGHGWRELGGMEGRHAGGDITPGDAACVLLPQSGFHAVSLTHCSRAVRTTT